MAIFCDLGGSNLALVGRAHRCIARADARPADDDGYVRDLLGLMGTTVIPERSVADRNRITSGGVTAGIDLGLSIAAHLRGEERVQLLLEYDPKPPFDAGSPDRAGDALVRDVLVRRSALIEAARVQAVEASKRI